MPNVLSPRDLVFRPDNMDETVPHIKFNNDLSKPFARGKIGQCYSEPIISNSISRYGSGQPISQTYSDSHSCKE